ncbi:MAG: hypothetical protein SWY16_09340 [Cyanobacteriota bacterium]|nr:hypothetical protein [Cyanobacteriota bacterium]
MKTPLYLNLHLEERRLKSPGATIGFRASERLHVERFSLEDLGRFDRCLAMVRH